MEGNKVERTVRPKTFEVKARPIDKIDGLRPGMSLVLKK